MLVFISGSINSGKTTVSRILADKLGAVFVNFDDLNDLIPNFDLKKDLSKSFGVGINKINELTDQGSDVVANYVVREEDWKRLQEEVKTKEKHFITLAPRLKIAQSNRGSRQLSDWEVARVKYHYDTGIANPGFGHIIDNSDIPVEETVNRILKLVQKKS